MQTLTAIQCNKCKNIIYSRCRHDFHSCECGACSIDGGFDYIRVIGKPEDFNTIKVSLDFDDFDDMKRALYEDWNNSINKYGTISDKKHIKQ